MSIYAPHNANQTLLSLTASQGRNAVASSSKRAITKVEKKPKPKPKAPTGAHTFNFVPTDIVSIRSRCSSFSSALIFIVGIIILEATRQSRRLPRYVSIPRRRRSHHHPRLGAGLET